LSYYNFNVVFEIRQFELPLYFKTDSALIVINNISTYGRRGHNY